MATEISEATQLSSPVAFAALHAALPIGCREAMLEACVLSSWVLTWLTAICATTIETLFTLTQTPGR